MGDTGENEEKVLKNPDHHKYQGVCETRPRYRQGKTPRAVKVFTVSSESKHLFVYGVPKINLRNELRRRCIKYGKIVNICAVEDHETEIFTECYRVTYEKIRSARVAKKYLDNQSFYGGILHVCYAPEYESVAETKAKLQQRLNDVIRYKK